MEAQLNVIGLFVEDMARSLAFYRILGIDVPAEADREPHVETLLAGGLRLTWDTVEVVTSFDKDWSKPHGGPGMAFAFRFETPAEVDTAYKELVAAGYAGHKEPWDAFWGQRYALVHDPDGNGVDLFSPLS